MNLPLILAGALALLAAAVHGIAGERLVIRRLAPGALPASPFGGPGATRAMLHISWHITTAAFLTAGGALVLAGSALDGDAARAVALVAAGGCTAFATVTVAMGAAAARTARSLWRHPGPVVLTLTAALSWWGAATVAGG